jgi:hypothetical protein
MGVVVIAVAAAMLSSFGTVWLLLPHLQAGGGDGSGGGWQQRQVEKPPPVQGHNGQWILSVHSFVLIAWRPMHLLENLLHHSLKLNAQQQLSLCALGLALFCWHSRSTSFSYLLGTPHVRVAGAPRQNDGHTPKVVDSSSSNHNGEGISEAFSSSGGGSGPEFSVTAAHKSALWEKGHVLLHQVVPQGEITSVRNEILGATEKAVARCMQCA